MDNSKESVGIIGAGVTGLFAAYNLAKRGYDVTLFDPSKQIGGLASCVDFAGTKIERFFHHFFSTDKELIALFEELHLQNEIIWAKSKVGFYHNHQYYPFNSSLDIIRFTPLSLKNRFLLGASILYFKYLKHYAYLEKISIKDWYKRIGGEQVFDIVWKPLLISKFGIEHCQDIPASWLWGRIHSRVNSRAEGGEQLGYLRGSMQALFDKIADKIGYKNFVNEIATFAQESPEGVTIATPQRSYVFDRVIVTTPLPLFFSFYKNTPVAEEKVWKNIRYQGVLCAILEMDKPLSEYYWLNIIDENISFAGIIEQTNLIPLTLYRGRSIAYVFNYLQSTHPFFQLSDEEVIRKYSSDIKKMFPNFRRSSIQNFVVSRTKYATPIYALNYSTYIPPMKLTDKIFLANTSQIYPQDRNINNSMKLVNNLMKYF